MRYEPKKVIRVALNEVGYLEKETRADLDSKTGNAGEANYTKYARDLDALGFYNGRKQGVAWCDVFVDWCFVQAYGKEAALRLTHQPVKAANNCGAGCRYSRQYYERNGRLFDAPEPGDQFFFYSKDKAQISHTGLVYDVDRSYVYTVEGNASGASGVVANGGAVAKKKYRLGYERLAGFGRPEWGEEDEGETGTGMATELGQEDEVGREDGETMRYTVRKGDTLWGISRKLLGRGNRYPEIMALNELTSTVIRVGERLRVPVG